MPEVLRGHPDAWREQGRRRGAIKRRKGYDRDRVKKQAAEIGLATLPGRDVVLHFAAQDPTRREILTVEGREIGRVQDARGNSFRVYTKAAGERQRRKKRPEERIEAERARHQRDKVVSGVASGLGALGLTAGGALVAHRLRLRQVRRQHGEQVEGLNAALRKAKGERISQGKRSKAQARADEAQAARDQGTMVDLPVPGLGKKKA